MCIGFLDNPSRKTFPSSKSWQRLLAKLNLIFECHIFVLFFFSNDGLHYEKLAISIISG